MILKNSILRRPLVVAMFAIGTFATAVFATSMFATSALAADRDTVAVVNANGNTGANTGEAAPPAIAFQQQIAPPVIDAPALPRMAPELALNTFQQRGKTQSAGLAWYTDDTEVDAELPDTSQKGSYELVREYS